MACPYFYLKGYKGEAVVLWFSAVVCEPRVLSFFDITVEWPRTAQIVAILSSYGTNKRLYASEGVAVISLARSQHIHENLNI